MGGTIKSMQAWLKSCPFVTDIGGSHVAFRINYLGSKPVEFAIEDTPGDPILQKYISGSLRVKNFVLASRMEYSEQIAQQAGNSEFWEAFSDWIESKSDAKELPTLAEGKTPRSVAVTSTGYIITSAAGTCKFQIQIQLQYYQKGAREQ